MLLGKFQLQSVSYYYKPTYKMLQDNNNLYFLISQICPYDDKTVLQSGISLTCIPFNKAKNVHSSCKVNWQLSIRVTTT